LKSDVLSDSLCYERQAARTAATVGEKGSNGIGERKCFGILRCAQDDSLSNLRLGLGQGFADDGGYAGAEKFDGVHQVVVA
jgi:hypothetical protein